MEYRDLHRSRRDGLAREEDSIRVRPGGRRERRTQVNCVPRETAFRSDSLPRKSARPQVPAVRSLTLP